MMRPIVVILALAAVSAAQGTQTFSGVITDSMCSTADHSQMRIWTELRPGRPVTSAQGRRWRLRHSEWITAPVQHG
jgi:hypothetical protein